ncbi:MAG: hypothetical protein NTX57_01610 [Armatimonadetes bacterium]|nr:hypothetical protein [Armatimonadota bacterium]
MTSFWIAIGLATVAVLALLFWWRRPVSWEDGESSTLHDEGPLLDTDGGRSRWWWFFSYDANRLTQWLFNLKDWFENQGHRRK